jgi:hypothetical protein
MRTTRTLVVFLVLLFLTAPSQAASVGGVDLPAKLTAGGDELLLNGAGLRKKFIIKVYAGGLYLKQKMNAAGEIIAADAPMAIRMHFIYDGVKSKSLIEAWNEGFANATGGNTAPIQKEIDRFNGFFTQEAQKGDVYDVVYVPGQGVTVTIKGQVKGTIPGLAFKQAVFAIWLGEKPADKGLKKGMLGQ